MSKKYATPQIPGGQLDSDYADVADTQDAEDTRVADDAPVKQDADVVTMSRTEFNALTRRIAKLEEAKPAGRIPHAAREAALPNADDIDKAALKSPVLTKTGWLVPEKFGSHPNAPK